MVKGRKMGGPGLGNPLAVAAGLALTLGLIHAPFHSLQAAEAASNETRPPAASHNDISSMSIEELMQVKLSLSRTEETYSGTPAAAYIVTSDDIRRSGATSIPEALRGVPGLEVARVDSHSWAVTARGFNDNFANKLLVMIDGRTAYTPLFSGVFWDVQDTLLEDIDHIEVIRGPGSTLWGANAVNGVINIVTKDAAATQGGLMTAGGGYGEVAFGSIRYGGQLSETVHYRAYVKYFDREDTALREGSHSGEWDAIRGGFRLDWAPGRNAKSGPSPNLFTLEGELYRGRNDQFFTAVPPFPEPHVAHVHDIQKTDGGHVLGRWTSQLSDDSSLQVQAYYDRTRRDLVIFGEERDTFDLDVQHRFKAGERQEFVWGMGYRLTRDSTASARTVTLDPASRTLNLFSTFAQDEISIIEHRLRLTLGTKLEHNDFTGWEVQPGARLLFTPTESQSLWGSVTRAVRTPSRAESDVTIRTAGPGGAPALVLGNPEIASEKLLAYEIGYRVQPLRSVSLDVAAYYNTYDELRTLDFTGVSSAGVITTAHNRMEGSAAGVELGGTWQVTPCWRLKGSYTWMELDLDKTRGGGRANTLMEKSSPRQQVMVRSLLDLPHGFEFDAAVRYVESLETQRFGAPGLQTLHVPSYVGLDLRLGWRPRRDLEFSVAGQNLIENQHAEFQPTTIRSPSVEVERIVYGKVTWQF